mmetsp:Transcript_12435/g.13620  ORF Transcript_12435/g.13620 Transcript_12435/m.13620 type:complete len:459 (-) Transcript_12435:286-1662(-)
MANQDYADSQPLLSSLAEKFRGSYRWMTIFAVSLTQFGIYYVMDNPEVLENELRSTYKLSNVQYNAFYGFVSIPNIILSPFVGAINKFTTLRNLLMFYITLSTVGQLIFWYGSSIASYDVMLWGRIVFGAGASTSNCVVCSVIYRWFRNGYELGMANSVSLSISRVGSLANNYLNVILLNQDMSLPSILAISFCIMAVCWVVGFYYLYLDRKLDNLYIREGAAEHIDDPSQDQGQKMTWADLKGLTPMWIAIALYLTFIYINYSNFLFIANAFLQTQFGYDKIWASTLVSFPAFCSMIVGPWSGRFVDSYGRKAQLLLYSSVAFLIVHSLLLFSMWVPNGVIVTFAFILFGLAYTLFSSCAWVCIPLAVTEKLAPTAYGITFALQDVGILISSYMVGFIRDDTEDQAYTYVVVYFIGAVVCAILANFAIIHFDNRSGRVLFKPTIIKEKTDVDEYKIN